MGSRRLVLSVRIACVCGKLRIVFAATPGGARPPDNPLPALSTPPLRHPREPRRDSVARATPSPSAPIPRALKGRGSSKAQGGADRPQRSKAGWRNPGFHVRKIPARRRSPRNAATPPGSAPRAPPLAPLFHRRLAPVRQRNLAAAPGCIRPPDNPLPALSTPPLRHPREPRRDSVARTTPSPSAPIPRALKGRPQFKSPGCSQSAEAKQGRWAEPWVPRPQNSGAALPARNAATPPGSAPRAPPLAPLPHRRRASRSLENSTRTQRPLAVAFALQAIHCPLYALQPFDNHASPERARQLKSPGWSRPAAAKQGRLAEPWVHIRRISGAALPAHTAATPPGPRAPLTPTRATPPPPSRSHARASCS